MWVSNILTNSTIYKSKFRVLFNKSRSFSQVDNLTVWIGQHSRADPWESTTDEEPKIVQGRQIARVLRLVPVGRQLQLEVLVDDKVGDGLTDAPVGRWHAAPKPQNSLRAKIRNLSKTRLLSHATTNRTVTAKFSLSKLVFPEKNLIWQLLPSENTEHRFAPENCDSWQSRANTMLTPLTKGRFRQG